MEAYILVHSNGDVLFVGNIFKEVLRHAIEFYAEMGVSSKISHWKDGAVRCQYLLRTLSDCLLALEEHLSDNDVLRQSLRNRLLNSSVPKRLTLQEAMHHHDEDTSYRKVWWKKYRKNQ